MIYGLSGCFGSIHLLSFLAYLLKFLLIDKGGKNCDEFNLTTDIVLMFEELNLEFKTIK